MHENDIDLQVVSLHAFLLRDTDKRLLQRHRSIGVVEEERHFRLHHMAKKC
jgi:hypothetical protein